ncbi:MAG TPA: class I SAM-dependent methyltransferase [Steroidobacteraceae bacterium]|jgi:predicted O-methyltransferase YrrM|nr:class I SAM-dependent methyltransferase [Steroidobacteraceae bacterium]
MSTRNNSGMSAAAHEYMLGASLREAPVLARLRAATAPRPEAEMQIGPEQGQFMAFLVRLTGARRCIELGTYTGYSALAVALALPPDGSIVACDVSDEFTRIGRPFWREAGVESKIDLRLKPALESLDELLAQPGGRGGYDFAFVDADKGNYIAYYEKLLELMRPGGLITVDNTLGVSGKYVTELTSPSAQAIRAFNAHVHQDTRVDLSMLPIGEGLTLLRVL